MVLEENCQYTLVCSGSSGGTYMHPFTMPFVEMCMGQEFYHISWRMTRRHKHTKFVRLSKSEGYLKF